MHTTADSATPMQRLLERQRAAFHSDPLPSATRRREDLKRLAAAVNAHRRRLADAVDADFNGRSRDETLVAEIFPSLEGIRHALQHV